MDNKKTCDLNTIINGIKDEKKLNSYVADIKDSCRNDGFTNLFHKVCERNNLENSDILPKTNISKSHYYDIVNGKSNNPGRDKMLQICIVAGFTLEETQKALTRTTCGILYPKVERDTIIMFCIVNKLSLIETNEKLYERDLEIIK